MKRGSTNILRAAIILFGLVVLALCVGLGFLIFDGEENYRTPVWGLLVLSSLPFSYALFQTMKLLNYIDRNTVFSVSSVRALRAIKYCALTISGFFVVASPYIFHVAQKDDAPGMVLIAAIIIGTSFLIATSAAVLQRLLESVNDLKSENDLTV